MCQPHKVPGPPEFRVELGRQPINKQMETDTISGVEVPGRKASNGVCDREQSKLTVDSETSDALSKVILKL